MLKKYKLKKRIEKIILSNFKDDFPYLYVEKKKEVFNIYYFRTSPNQPTPEEMQSFLEYGLNRNIRRKSETSDINTTIYFLTDYDYQIKADKDNNLSKIDFGFNLDMITSINLIKSPHILINGATGTGKTYLLAYIMAELKSAGAEILVIDGKHTDLEIIGLILNDSNSNYKEDFEKVIEVHKEMNKRQMSVKESILENPVSMLGKDFRSHSLHPLVLVIDEYKSFIDSISKTEKINNISMQKHIENIIQDIVAKGRSLGVFVILSSQRFSTDTLKNDIRSNFGAIISLGNEKNETNLMLFSSTKVPIVGKYGGLLKSNEYPYVIEFKVPFINDLQRYVSKYK